MNALVCDIVQQCDSWGTVIVIVVVFFLNVQMSLNSKPLSLVLDLVLCIHYGTCHTFREHYHRLGKISKYT